MTKAKIQFFPLYFLTCLVLFSSPAYPQNSFTGEVVNINFDLKVVFTDLVLGQIEKGDIVEIYGEMGFITYLETDEVTDAVSKLGMVKRKGLISTEEDFKKIAIGHKVILVMPGKTQEDLDGLLSKISDSQEKASAERKQAQELSKQQNNCVEENKTMKEHIMQLEVKLKSIVTTLTKKIKEYDKK